MNSFVQYNRLNFIQTILLYINMIRRNKIKKKNKSGDPIILLLSTKKSWDFPFQQQQQQQLKQ